MRRVLFTWGRLTVSSYAAMLYLGLVCGMFAGLHAAALANLDANRTLAAIVLLLVPALLGARLLFVIGHWPDYRRSPARIWRAAEGGAAMYGGLVLAVPVSVPLLASLRLPFGTFWDVASFTMLVGLIITRAGCFLNGCCAGRPTDGWCGMYLPDHRGIWKRRVPTQLLDAAWGLVVLAGAVAVWRSLTFPGELFLYTIGAYGAGRLALESARERQPRALGSRLNLVLSTACVAVAVVAFTLTWRW